MRYINQLFTYLLLLTASSLVAIAQYFWRIRTSLFFVYEQKFNIEAVNDYPPIGVEILFERKFPICRSLVQRVTATLNLVIWSRIWFPDHFTSFFAIEESGI